MVRLVKFSDFIIFVLHKNVLTNSSYYIISKIL